MVYESGPLQTFLDNSDGALQVCNAFGHYRESQVREYLYGDPTSEVILVIYH